MSAIATIQQRQTLIAKFASRFHIEGEKLLPILKATAFKQGANDPEVSNEQMAALMVVADQYGLNPFTREIFAFPDKHKGIVPVVSVDGWARIINDHPSFDGMDFVQDDNSCTCIIYRKDRAHPIKVTEYMAECKRGTGPWQSHPRRMLRHKALIQCARIAFSFAGIYDEDEAERIIERDITPPKPAIDMPRAKNEAKPAEPQPEATTPAAEAQPAATEKPAAQGEIKPSQARILKAKMDAAGLTATDFEAGFPGKCIEPTDGKTLLDASEFNAVAAWIAERAAA